MKTINTQNLKGVNDYYGKEQLVRNKIINTLKKTFENYGYSPLDSSILYNYDVLAYKYEEDGQTKYAYSSVFEASYNELKKS